MTPSSQNTSTPKCPKMSHFWAEVTRFSHDLARKLLPPPIGFESNFTVIRSRTADSTQPSLRSGASGSILPPPERSRPARRAGRALCLFVEGWPRPRAGKLACSRRCAGSRQHAAEPPAWGRTGAFSAPEKSRPGALAEPFVSLLKRALCPESGQRH